MTKPVIHDWKTLLKQGVSNPKDLLAYLELDEKLLPDALSASQDFAFKVPKGFADRMQKGNPDDPLLKQVLPIGAELINTPGFISDPLQEAKSNPLPGLLHKYKNRVLFIATGVCAINCRYCFRRHFPYPENNPGKAGWDQVLAYIARDPSISEVILSGGDPMVMTDNQLSYLIKAIEKIAHVETLRIHSRLPIVLPERITDELVNLLQSSRLNMVMVVHSNHGNEVNDSVRESLKKLKLANVHLLNQAVLLKGINDTLSDQIHLHKTLFSAGVLPYYLHLLDAVTGAAHFDVPENQAIALIDKLKVVLPGYLIPRLVKEIAGATSKTIIY